jgi:transcription initiation factor IIE alpha subunit
MFSQLIKQDKPTQPVKPQRKKIPMKVKIDETLTYAEKVPLITSRELSDHIKINQSYALKILTLLVKQGSFVCKRERRPWANQPVRVYRKPE